MTDRPWLSFVTGLLLIWLAASTGLAQRLNHNSYLGKSPPELESRPDHWLGWHEQVTLADLRGKVVWLQFNFSEHCTSLRHHLVEKEEQYSDAGLVVIEINRCLGDPLQLMRYIVESQSLKHPVLWDAGCRNAKAYGITAWPYAYLIGADGNVFWEGNPSRWIHRRQKSVQLRDDLERELGKVRSSPPAPVPVDPVPTECMPIRHTSGQVH